LNKILVIATHPDDETLGCGGALLRHVKNNDKVFWLITTKMSDKKIWTKKSILLRDKEIKLVSKAYKFKKIYNLEFETIKLDTVPINRITKKLSEVVNDCKPNIIYCPNETDVHTDHQVTSKACRILGKSFRFPFIKKILSYEVLSETDSNFFEEKLFKPNYFINIEKYLEKKIKIMKIYKSELKKFPFPRSAEAIRSLAKIRGSQSNFKNAEAFKLIKEIY